MADTAIKASLVTNDPNLFFSGAELAISIPVSNVGDGTADQVFVTAITLGTATRTSPAQFPVYVGSLAPGATGAVNARFDGRLMAAGQRYLLTIRGTFGKPALGFTVSRYVQVPPAEPFPVTLLRSHVSVLVEPAQWSYTLYNDEASGSALYIAAFSLDIVAPISVLASPPGWQVESDFISYVGWFATDTAAPFPNHVAPGASLGGFRIQSATARSESTSYLLGSLDHGTAKAGIVGMDVVLSPARAL